MTYINDNLKPNEKILFETRLHWISLVIAALWSWIFLFIPMIFYILEYLKTEFAVTDQRVVIKHGILSMNVDESPLDKVQSINLRQSFIGRLLNYGNIVVQTAATLSAHGFPYVKDPHKLRKTVSEQMDVYKETQLRRQAEMIAQGMRGNYPSQHSQSPAETEIEWDDIPTHKAKTISCPRCKTPITITTPQRPITITCPNCKASGTIRN